MTDLERLLEYLPEQHWSQEIVAVHLEEDAARKSRIAILEAREEAFQQARTELAALREAALGHWDHDDRWCFSCHQAFDECEFRQLIEESQA